uniref:Uncharacterized protein n=1 Tax=Anguilla anguilla TaxID=7936 RepID=A0A0E9PDV0_ANGAN
MPDVGVCGGNTAQ